MSLNQAVPSADAARAHPADLHSRLTPGESAKSRAPHLTHFSLTVHVSCMLNKIGEIQGFFVKNPDSKMAENLIMHTCTEKRDSYPRPPFSAIMGRTCILAPATVSPQFMADSSECHTMPNMSPRRVDRGDLRPYLSLTVSRKTWPFRHDSGANRT